MKGMTMNRIKLSLLVLASLGMCLLPKASADDEAVAAIGGFVAGIITSAIIDHNEPDLVVVKGGHGSHRGYRDQHCDRAGRGHWERRVSVCPPPRPKRDCGNYQGPRGHWEIRYERVWVPGHWEVRKNRCGDRYRVWNEGHYRTEKRKVWVRY
jgi:hypothetical protein